VTERARQEYAEAVRARYQHADKAGKGGSWVRSPQFPCRLHRAEASLRAAGAAAELLPPCPQTRQ